MESSIQTNYPVSRLDATLAPLGFRQVRPKNGGVCSAIWKRQTFNTNRAVVFVECAGMPEGLPALVKAVRKEAAFRCKFVPFFYGLGTQLVILATGPRPGHVDLGACVDKVDNQWSIIQSIFLVHRDVGLISSVRTWGQFVTGKYQDAITGAVRLPEIQLE